ncbi:MAG: protease complex subunit PrcB family protein [SAR324 cluster bacterium]|nr:protease complex subunit PrcB family protein [SAR324 cluster bacterium]
MQKILKQLVWMTALICWFAGCSVAEDGEINTRAESGIDEDGSSDFKVAGVTGIIGVSVGVLGTAFGDGNSNGKQSLIEFETISKGNESAISSLRNEVIDSEEAWAALWKEHLPGSLEIPAIDFTNKEVIGVFSGTRSSGGYTLEIDQVTGNGDKITISYIETTPGANCFTTLSLTSPFHLIQIEKTGKKFQFSMKSQVNSCQE